MGPFVSRADGSVILKNPFQNISLSNLSFYGARNPSLLHCALRSIPSLPDALSHSSFYLILSHSSPKLGPRVPWTSYWAADVLTLTLNHCGLLRVSCHQNIPNCVEVSEINGSKYALSRTAAVWKCGTASIPKTDNKNVGLVSASLSTASNGISPPRPFTRFDAIKTLR